MTYGANYLSVYGHIEEITQRVNNHEHDRMEAREHLKERMSCIRDKWRTQRFPTRSLGPLELKAENYLIPEIQGNPNFSNQGNDSYGSSQKPITMVRVTVNDNELRDQLAAYSKELQMRTDARYHRAEQERMHFEREQRNLEERKKKMVCLVLQRFRKPKRVPNMCLSLPCNNSIFNARGGEKTHAASGTILLCEYYSSTERWRNFQKKCAIDK